MNPEEDSHLLGQVDVPRPSDKVFSQSVAQYIINPNSIFKGADRSPFGDCMLRKLDKSFLPLCRHLYQVMNSLVAENIDFHSLGLKLQAGVRLVRAHTTQRNVNLWAKSCGSEAARTFEVFTTNRHMINGAIFKLERMKFGNGALGGFS